MRIAYLITRMDSIGGAQIHVRGISLWLRQNGHDPIVVTGACGPTCETLVDTGVEPVEARGPVRPVRPLRDVCALLAICRRLVSWHSSKAGILGRCRKGNEHPGDLHCAWLGSFGTSLERTQRWTL